MADHFGSALMAILKNESSQVCPFHQVPDSLKLTRIYTSTVPMHELIPRTQLAAIVPKQGGPVEFDDNYPVQVPGHNEVLVKVLYTGVCQSGE